MATITSVQRRLTISKAEVLTRTILILLFTLLLTAGITRGIHNFPWEREYTQETLLLPIFNMPEIRRREAVKYPESFVRLAQGNQVFLNIGPERITYFTVKGGTLYSYQQVSEGIIGYAPTTVSIKDGIATRNLRRDWEWLAVHYIMFPILLSLVSLAIFLCILFKPNGQTMTLFWRFSSTND